MPTKEEIKRLENEKRSKADAFGKTGRLLFYYYMQKR